MWFNSVQSSSLQHSEVPVCLMVLPIYFVVHSLSHVWFFATPWAVARQASLSFTISQSLLRLMSDELKMPSSHLILCCPLVLLPSIFPSIRVLSNELALRIRWSKYFKSLLEHPSLKASILRHSAIFMVQLSHPYMTTGKIIILTIWTFVSIYINYATTISVITPPHTFLPFTY